MAEFTDSATRYGSVPSTAPVQEQQAFDEICTLIKRCWDGDSSKRPTMLDTRTLLQALVERLSPRTQQQQEVEQEQEQEPEQTQRVTEVAVRVEGGGEGKGEDGSGSGS